MITVSGALFFGLVVLAIIPAYGFAGYAFYVSKKTTDVMTKYLEKDLRAGMFGSPNIRLLDEDEFAKMYKKPPPIPKKEGEEIAPTRTGQYI